MATNEEVLIAIQNLTTAYNQLRDEVAMSGNYPVPQFNGGVCYWDGYDNLAADSELYSNIMLYGSVTKVLYGIWNNSYMITINQGTGFAQPKSGMPERCAVIKVKLNDLTNDKKAFFLKQSNGDNQAYGYISAYLCDKNTLIPYKFLGTDNSDKGTGEGVNIRFDMFNGNAQQTRYHQWLSYSFNLQDAESSIDDDGYIYIGITSTVATYYISGWGVANRNTDFLWQNAYVMTAASLPMSAVPVADSTAYGGVYSSHFARGTAYNGFEIPYDEHISGDVLITFMDRKDDTIYQGSMTLKGSTTGTVFHQDSCHVGNFGRLMRFGLDTTNLQSVSFVIPRQEVTDNTVTRNGKKYLSFDIPVFKSERNFYFCALYTEEYKEI